MTAKLIPTENEINVRASLDEQSACLHFLGKTVEEAELLFRENSIYYQEDLIWMGPRGFIFYVPAYLRYILSGAPPAGSDDVNCLAGLLEFRLKYSRESIEAVRDELLGACEYVVGHWGEFNVSVEIYGDLAGRYVALIGDLKKMAGR